MLDRLFAIDRRPLKVGRSAARVARTLPDLAFSRVTDSLDLAIPLAPVLLIRFRKRWAAACDWAVTNQITSRLVDLPSDYRASASVRI
jgi:hypothetical protein